MKKIKIATATVFLLFSSFSFADFIDEDIELASAPKLEFNSDEQLKQSLDDFDQRLSEFEEQQKALRLEEQRRQRAANAEKQAKAVPVKPNYQCDPLEIGHILIDTANRALCVGDGSVTRLYPVAIGKLSTKTPAGNYTVTHKKEWPDWYPPEHIRYENPHKVLPTRVPGGKGNPLGARAIYLNHNGIRIHGTNNESSIGKAVSHGCIRMYNKDVEEVYELVSVDSPVSIR